MSSKSAGYERTLADFINDFLIINSVSLIMFNIIIYLFYTVFLQMSGTHSGKIQNTLTVNGLYLLCVQRVYLFFRKFN